MKKNSKQWLVVSVLSLAMVAALLSVPLLSGLVFAADEQKSVEAVEQSVPEGQIDGQQQKAKVINTQPQPRQERGAVVARVEVPPRAATVSARIKPRHRIYQYMPDSSKSYGTESMLSDLSKEVAGKVYYELKEEGQRNLTSRVAVVAAVPLADLKRETEFGRVIAEYYLTDLADRGIKVKELRLGKDINILPQTGEFILSRNIGEIANNSPALDYVVVSTFTNTRKTLILQGRLVSLKTGLIKSSWRYNLPLNRELLGLFYSVDQPFTIAVKGMGR